MFKNDTRLTQQIRSFGFGIGIAVGVATSSLASAANFDLWRASSDPTSYVLHNNNTGEYVETINCRVAFRFVVNKTFPGGVVLYDASRNLYVQLTQSAMSLWPAGATNWSYFKAGTFDNRSMFEHQDKSGGITGAIWMKDACRWEEYLGGTARPDFRFQQVRVTDGTVVLGDSSRDLYVMLGDGAMYLHKGVVTDGRQWVFFKKGYWGR